jgi:murein DD-endopeptidase MepM/ murein hydrolase activator NlpD
LTISYRILLLSIIAVILVAAWWLAPTVVTWAARLPRLRAFFDDPAAHAEWTLTAGQRCGDAPFMWPTTGYLGFGYGDSWSLGHRHTGFDIFGPAGLNETPVYAAYPGHLTRKPDWKSTVIIRIPHDPLDPARQIWTYYTHMAGPNGDSYIAPEFPPGTEEVFVEAGTLLGYQGNFSGEAGNPVGIHLHFSIVKDDGAGQFRNESRLENTLDPSPYLGVRAGVFDDWSQPVMCATT